MGPYNTCVCMCVKKFKFLRKNTFNVVYVKFATPLSIAANTSTLIMLYLHACTVLKMQYSIVSIDVYSTCSIKAVHL